MTRLLTLTALLATLAGGVAYAAAPAPRWWWDRNELELHASIILTHVTYQGRHYSVGSHQCYPIGPSLRSPVTRLPAYRSFFCELKASTLAANWEDYLGVQRVSLTGTLAAHPDGSGTFHALSPG